MSDNTKKKLIIFVLCFLFFLSYFLIYFWQAIYFPKEPTNAEAEIFIINRGEGTKEISVNLEKEGLIKSSIPFRFYTLLEGAAGNLQAGEYLISPSMTIPEILEKFVAGDVIKEKITIVEGWNLWDIGTYFEEEGLFPADEFFGMAGLPLINYSKETDLPKPKDFSSEFDFLADKPKYLRLEGYLFPDTYFIQLRRDDSTFSTIVENVLSKDLEGVVKKMLENFGRKLTLDLREEIKAQNKTIFETVTMASLIEKEVRTLKDKKLVSGILWKRIQNNIPLQVDATITYITGKKSTRVSIEETKIDSPYNTYKYAGLPLGPICNPGLDSILAAIYPKQSQNWYYLSTPEGETIFSETLGEHNIKKVKYLK